jgi:acyl carrier protein
MTPAEAMVIRELEEVIRGKGFSLPNLSPETVLDQQLGLESLDFAELVIRLEQATGKDPFGSTVTPQIRTVSDLAALYEMQQ